MALKLYNTLTRQKEEFKPIDPKNVRMYVCGPTVYDYAHVGNARPVIVFDVLFRLLRHMYGEDHVTYVRNVTDVDDKINARSKEWGEKIESITARTYQWYAEDMKMVGALPPTFEPRATHYIPDMIRMIEGLIAKNHAYVAENHVLFSVPSMKDYGKLSRRNREDMIAGARVDVAPYKRDPADFVLWKPSTPDLPGWDSPWGRGRPGWHIECSAMSEKLLGNHFDIHGGGQDLIFPHHENEIAQSECAHGEPMANIWMHNGWLMIDQEKMSKSLGNFFTVREVLEKLGGRGEIIRLATLMSHYRQPMDWTESLIQQSKAILDSLYNKAKPDSGKIPDEFMSALNDDLNTPQAITILQHMDSGVLAAANLLGLLTQTPEQWKKSGVGENEETAIQQKIAERNAAKKAKDFARADAIRKELEGQGIILEDKPAGTEWRRK
ncbi:MAG: cysteine--tRNA ligase [Dongiaceae bacterium]